jgi:sec-independent protein translocase protein TatA
VGIENPVHLLFIAIVALIVLGPKRLPALARAVGQGMREFRHALNQGAEGDADEPTPAHSQQPAQVALAPPEAAPAEPPVPPEQA